MNPGLRLSQSTLPQIARIDVGGLAVEMPTYVRRLDKRICHIGVGGFHRSHQAHYLHRLLQQGLGDGWGLCGIALRSADLPLHQALHEQDLLYSLWEVDADRVRVSVIGSMMAYVDASADIAPALTLLSDAATRIVSLTITEAGYCLGAGGELNEAHPDIVRDLAHFERPRSAQGLIVKALSNRRDAGIGGFTLMSCDNLIENGHRLRSSILGFARRIDASLAEWIAAAVSFPSSMVDRITPAVDRERSHRLCSRWGVQDEALVLCEPWQQWILEDDFVAGRPAFEKAGVVLSDHVGLFEAMKVGLLNGGHSALSHLGLLSGHSSVHEALSQPPIGRWLKGTMQEIATTLEAVPGVRFDEYEASLIQRFLNPAIEDRLQRLAQDSSSKFQQVLLPPLLKCLERGQPFEHLAAALALWMLYLARLQLDPAARDAYQDTNKELLISLAVAAVERDEPHRFLASNFAIPANHVAKVCERVGHHLRGFRAVDYDGHLRSIGSTP